MLSAKYNFEILFLCTQLRYFYHRPLRRTLVLLDHFSTLCHQCFALLVSGLRKTIGLNSQLV
jgi:uncharacterized membrane protein